MHKNKLKLRELIKKSLTLTDSVTELDSIIEKLFVLSSDVFENYIEKIDFKTIYILVFLMSNGTMFS